MNAFDSVEVDRKSFAFNEACGQKTEWTPRHNPRLVTVSGNVNPLDALVRVDATAGAVTLTLETAVGCDGRQHIFKKIDSSGNAMTIDGAGSETIDGVATKASTTQYGVIWVMSNGVNWDIIG